MSGLRLIAAAHTPALRRAVFGGDDDLDEGGRNAALALRAKLGDRATAPDGALWVCAPSRAAEQTARALGAESFTVAPELADVDYGTWTGRSLDEVASSEAASSETASDEPAPHPTASDEVGPDETALSAWLTSPDAAPHGGESLSSVTARAGLWLEQQAGRSLTAVAHPTVVRSLLAYALSLPPDGVWQLDVAPLAVSRLTHRAGRWHLSIR